MKNILTACAVLLHIIGYSQNDAPYKFSAKTDGIISVTLLASTATYFVLQQHNTALTSSDISGLSVGLIHPFDRSTVTEYNPNHAKISKQIATAGLIGSVGMQGLTVLAASTFSQSYKNHVAIAASMWLQTNIAAYVGAGICKTITHRVRPFVYNTNVPIKQKLTIDAQQSFFSRHTALTAANTFLAAHVVSSYYTPSSFTYSVWTAAAVIPAAVGYFRVSSGEHFTTDVMVGYVYGALCGLAIPYLHTQHKHEDSHVRINAVSPDYVSVSFVW